MAEKNRFSRWGPYINHIGLIIFLLAVLGRSVPAWNMDQYVYLDDGETEQIPGTNYFVKNEKFTVEYYSDEELPPSLKGTGRAKKFNTKAVLYECESDCDDPTKEPKLRAVKNHDIRMNHPLSYHGLSLYQIDFDKIDRLISVSPMVINKKTGEKFGPFFLPMRNPALTYEVGPYTLTLKDKFMDFGGFDSEGRPMSKSRDPNAPAFVFLVKGPDLPPTGETYLYFPKPNDKIQFQQDFFNKAVADKFEIRAKMEDVSKAEYVTVLNVRIDRAMPFVWTGAAIFMIGVVMGLYWNHRRIWLRFDDGVLSLGAHTNKNYYGIRAELAAAMGKAGLAVTEKSLDNRRKSQ